MSEQPNLSLLSREQRVNVAVAEVLEAEWREDEHPLWDFTLWDPFGYALASVDANGKLFTSGRLPDYMTDPAAWGALMEKELDAVECCITTDKGAPRNRQWRGRWTETSPFPVPTENQQRGPWVWPLGDAVCAAVLAKHGIDWDTLEPMT